MNMFFPNRQRILKPGDVLENESFADALARIQEEERRTEFSCIDIRRRHEKQKGAELTTDKEVETF